MTNYEKARHFSACLDGSVCYLESMEKIARSSTDALILRKMATQLAIFKDQLDRLFPEVTVTLLPVPGGRPS